MILGYATAIVLRDASIQTDPWQPETVVQYVKAADAEDLATNAPAPYKLVSYSSSFSQFLLHAHD